MAKIDTDKFIALLVEMYCQRNGIDRRYVHTYMDDVLEQMGLKIENGEIVYLNKAAESNAAKKEILDFSLCEFVPEKLSIRVYNVLFAANIKTVRDLVKLHRQDILVMKHSGPKTFGELDKFLKDHDLHWGMNV